MAARGITPRPAGSEIIEYTDYRENVTGTLSNAVALIEKEAAAATSEVQQHIAEAQNRLAEWGEPLLDITSQVVEGIGVIADILPGFVETATGFFTDFWGTLGDLFSSLFSSLGKSILSGISSLGTSISESIDDWGNDVSKALFGYSKDEIPNNTNPQQPMP